MSVSTFLHDGQSGGSHGGTGELGPGEVSVLELQQALRHARGRSGQRPTSTADSPHPGPTAGDVCPLALGQSAPDESAEDSSSNRPFAGAAVDPGWLVVLAAHSGAGASTIALGLLDTMAAAGRRPTLVESSPASRSGLVAAAEAELGPDPSGQWLRGRRSSATLLRVAPGVSPSLWPAEITDPPSQAARRAESTVVDLGLAGEGILRWLGAAPRMVLVARATVPGLGQAEHLLSRLDPSHPVVLVTLGDSARTRLARASEGRRTQQLREQGAVLNAPLDRRLGVRGLSSDPLPKSLLGLCSRVLALLDQPPNPTPPGLVSSHAEDDGKDAA